MEQNFSILIDQEHSLMEQPDESLHP